MWAGGASLPPGKANSWKSLPTPPLTPFPLRKKNPGYCVRTSVPKLINKGWGKSRSHNLLQPQGGRGKCLASEVRRSRFEVTVQKV